MTKPIFPTQQENQAVQDSLPNGNETKEVSQETPVTGNHQANEETVDKMELENSNLRIEEQTSLPSPLKQNDSQMNIESTEDQIKINEMEPKVEEKVVENGIEEEEEKKNEENGIEKTEEKKETVEEEDRMQIEEKPNGIETNENVPIESNTEEKEVKDEKEEKEEKEEESSESQEKKEDEVSNLNYNEKEMKFDPNRSFHNKKVKCIDKNGVFELGKIRCECCGESYSPTNWEKHAGSAQKRPYNSIILSEENMTLTQFRSEMNYDASRNKFLFSGKRSNHVEQAEVKGNQPRNPTAVKSGSRSHLFSSTNQPKRIKKIPGTTPEKKTKDPTSKSKVVDYFEKTSSPLANLKVLKNLAQPDLLNYTNTQERNFLMKFLPEEDQNLPMEQLFKLEGFQNCLCYWAEMLRQGQFDPQKQDALNERRERIWNSEPWKKDYFLNYWGKELLSSSHSSSNSSQQNSLPLSLSSPSLSSSRLNTMTPTEVYHFDSDENENENNEGTDEDYG